MFLKCQVKCEALSYLRTGRRETWSIFPVTGALLFCGGWREDPPLSSFPPLVSVYKNLKPQRLLSLLFLSLQADLPPCLGLAPPEQTPRRGFQASSFGEVIPGSLKREWGVRQRKEKADKGALVGG